MASKEDYLKFMSEVRKVSGVDMLTPDETGLVSIRVDDAYNVNLQFAAISTVKRRKGCQTAALGSLRISLGR